MSSLTLYDIDAALLRLQDELELLSPEEQEQRLSILDEMAVLDAAGREKCDNFVHYLRHIETLAEAKRAEVGKLEEQARKLEQHASRLKRYVVRLLEAKAHRNRADKPYLEGNTYVLQPSGGKGRVALKCKNSEVPMVWKKSATVYEPDGARIREAIEAGDAEVVRFAEIVHDSLKIT